MRLSRVRGAKLREGDGEGEPAEDMAVEVMPVVPDLSVISEHTVRLWRRVVGASSPAEGRVVSAAEETEPQMPVDMAWMDPSQQPPLAASGVGMDVQVVIEGVPSEAVQEDGGDTDTDVEEDMVHDSESGGGRLNETSPRTADGVLVNM